MVNRQKSTIDVSDRASSELEYILRTSNKKSEAPKVSVEKALTQKRLYTGTARTATRVLFVSQDTSLLNPSTQTLDGFLNISDLFEEVHVLILRQGITPKNPVLRVAHNVWMYTAAASVWWRMPQAGFALAQEQLVFASGFRPDLVVARDPFESAIVAEKISRHFGCPAQLHVLDDYTSKEFVKKNPNNLWRQFLPLYTVKRFLSVRAASNTIEQMLAKRFTIPDVSTLPRFSNYEALITTTPTLNLKEKYKPFIFFILFVGRLHHESSLYRAVDAARFALRNPRVGMLVLGDGAAKSEFEKRTKLLGIQKQVIFETKVSDIVPYLKSSHLIIVTDTDTESDEIVLQAAAVGVPLVMSRTQKREDLFEHGVSAYLCEETDVQAFADRISDLLNGIGLRKVFVDSAQAMILKKFHQNPETYKEAYRASIEQALFIEADTEIDVSPVQLGG